METDLTHLIFDELGTTFITPFDREDIHDLASCMDDVIDGITVVPKGFPFIILVLFLKAEKN